MTAHKCTIEALIKHINTEAHAEQKILELREEAKKQQQWFEDQLASRADLAKKVEHILKDQIAGMEERHTKEVQLWADMKLQYEARARGHVHQKSTCSSCSWMSCGPRLTWGPKKSVPCCIRTGTGSKNS